MNQLSDSGSALPLFVWITGAVLFSAFAFFAFAQAAVARNGAQSAADAAALAAAQEARAELIDGLGEAISSDDDWQYWLRGENLEDGAFAVEAERLAKHNRARLVQIDSDVQRLEFKVHVRSGDPLGESVIPGTEGKRAEAQATAVVEPRCEPAADDAVEDVAFDCLDGESFELDPEDFDLDDFPEASKLFSVHLVG
ncbi:pilus assembly protein TadG-related protein [Streptomyces sp. BBFR102]|uniref:pilus assembly protein TadG-related protein n=1 Tax=Streptomyces sp. BBFR102 TaxID=3448171 RepID=UPI003F53B871